MARPRKAIPKDPEWKVQIRERMKPADFSVVIPKSSDFFSKWAVKWVNTKDNWMGQMKARYPGLTPCTTAEVDAPYARGESTNKNIYHSDLILMKYPRELREQMDEDKRLYSEGVLQGQYDAFEEMARSQRGVVEATSRLSVEEEEEEELVGA